MQYSNGKFIYLVCLIASIVRLHWVDCKGHFPTSVGFNIKINCLCLQLRRYIKKIGNTQISSSFRNNKSILLFHKGRKYQYI